ncbi:unnamed protein product [Echinostoma caproni]|uniref:cAMP-dependent protein kinase regulatory subunit n=1 Tax=Echinostoma caproni TaxID=27848 RepID=A0A183A6C2_9TREM|nr:unnamed protein product [Echinostoma caproni]
MKLQQCKDNGTNRLACDLVKNAIPTIEINRTNEAGCSGPESFSAASHAAATVVPPPSTQDNRRVHPSVDHPDVQIYPSGDQTQDETVKAENDSADEESQFVSRLELDNFSPIAAESYNPEDDNTELVVHPKSPEQRQRLHQALKDILIFQSLDEAQKTKVLDAMQEMKVIADQTVIRQGEDGNYFYVVETGQFDVFVDGIHVGSYNGFGSFGELALMYNTPRAATIVCTKPGILWTVDRLTFRRIVLRQAFEKRQMYENWLNSVPLLKNLSSYERTNLADALVSRSYGDGDWIIEQGQRGSEMYFIEEGSVAIIAKNTQGEEMQLKLLQANDYFGGECILLTKQTISVFFPGSVVLDVSCFERLMGPCLDVMLRKAKSYRDQLLSVMGETCLNTFPGLAGLNK